MNKLHSSMFLMLITLLFLNCVISDNQIKFYSKEGGDK